MLLKHVFLKRFFKEVKRQEVKIKKLEKVIFIQFCYNEKTIEAAVDAGISIATAYR